MPWKYCTGLTDKDLTDEFSGKSIGALVELIKSGKAYVNVHTDAYPDGEIRGQIK
ncbi:CHRD domain-containing protein [bacterium]|nr:CHRD domain-containing protein [bacterium]